MAVKRCGRSLSLEPTSRAGAQRGSYKASKQHCKNVKIPQNTLDLKAHLPLEYEIEPVSNNSHPYHLGAHVVTEVEPEGEVKGENITRVSNGGHEVEEVMVFPVVALQMLYDQHSAAVDQVHLELEVCVCARPVLVDAPSASVKGQQTPPHPFISQSGLINHLCATMATIRSSLGESSHVFPRRERSAF